MIYEESFDVPRLVSRHKTLRATECLRCGSLLPRLGVVKCPCCLAEMLVEQSPNWFYVTDVGAEE